MIPNLIIVSQVQSWFVARQQESTLKVSSLTDTSKNESRTPQTFPLNNGHQSCQILNGVSFWEFEKRNVQNLSMQRTASN